MAKDFSANVNTDKDAQQQQPVLLIILTLNIGTLRWVLDKSNFVFAGNTYTARFIEFPGVQFTAEGQIGRLSLKFDDVDSVMSGYLNAEDFYGKQLQVWRVWRNHTVSADDYNELFNGFCEEVPEINNTSMTVNATYGKPLEVLTLLNLYSNSCNRIFGDDVCNQDGLSDVGGALASNDVAVTSGSTNFVLNTTVVGSGTTDYWKYGKIQVWKKSSGVTATRRVISSSSGTSKIFFDTSAPWTIDNTYTFNVIKGCDKNYDTCLAQTTSGTSPIYGPSANNYLNFLGFIHTSKDVGGAY